MNLDDNTTFMTVLIVGTLAASIVGGLLALARGRIEAARQAAECPDCAIEVFHNVCTTRAERAREVDELLAKLEHVTPTEPSQDERAQP